MPVGAERVDAKLGDAQRFVRVRAFAKRQKDVRADVIGNRPVLPFIRGAPSGEAAHRIGKPGGPRAAPPERERPEARLLRAARPVADQRTAAFVSKSRVRLRSGMTGN